MTNQQFEDELERIPTADLRRAVDKAIVEMRVDSRIFLLMAYVQINEVVGRKPFVHKTAFRSRVQADDAVKGFLDSINADHTGVFTYAATNQDISIVELELV